MNILHLTHTFLPVTENWMYSQLTFNTRTSASVLCQYRENTAQFPFDAVYPRFADKSAITEVRTRLALRRGRYSESHALRVIEQVQPALVHGHFAFVSCCHLESVRSLSLPLVTTCYGIDISKLPLRTVWRKRYAPLFSYGSAFIVEGPHMANCLAGLGCPADKIHTIPIGVDLETISGKETVRSTDGKLHVLFTGLSREKKGALYAAAAFVNAARKHSNLHFDLIGNGKFLGPVRRTIETAGLADACTFHGSVTVARYRELLHASAIVLAPSVTARDGDTEGGAPVTVIEAQVAGIPVVGTRHCDIPFVVQHGETGLLCAEKDVGALSANLENLVTDVDMRIKMGKAAAMRAAGQHDIRKQVEKINEVYSLSGQF